MRQPRRPSVELTCKECHTTFVVRYSFRGALFCKRSCYDSATRHGRYTRGSNGLIGAALTKEFLQREYSDRHQPIFKIAAGIGCHGSTVFTYLKLHGIPILKDALKKGRPSTSSTSFKPGFTPWNKGKVLPRGEAHFNWRGGYKAGVKPQDFRTKDWRRAVMTRDNYTCQLCGVRGGKLCADHIKPWRTHAKLRYELSNGRVLCVNCHRKTDTYGWNGVSPRIRAVKPKEK